jgi:sulfur-oxidizing protein SoxZ
MDIGSAIIKVPTGIKKGQPFIVKFVIIHPMETGLRKDPKTEAIIPLNAITDIKITFNGKDAGVMKTSAGVSANPTFGVSLKINEPGVFKLAYKDTNGKSWEKSQEIKV